MAAAMRLCGRALWRTRQSATVSEQHRQLFPRRFARTRATTTEEQKDVAVRLEQIDEKKEELYNMIFDIVCKYKVPGKIGRENNLLLERLSVQVKPRPNDVYWRSCRRTEKNNRILTNVGAYSLGLVSPFVLHWLITEVCPRRKTWYEEWWDAVILGK
ncbi:uncharacterized protein LOC124686585 [Lolium rigidum]|uniref:uncharacterized protein LOC124686585 n=1 Tax=Lolium rigidum TaxID=89674 RepID=UPI001F5D0EA1|nr:uncharacterized protein LOC124686585 [Lolium rigidum]